MAQVVSQYTTNQVTHITGFSDRQLNYWATSKFIVPSIKQSDGPGTRRLYNFDDLVRLQFVKQLRQEGWSVQKIRKAIKHLNEFMNEKPEYRNFRLVHDKHTILILCETEERQQILLDALRPGGQQVLWIILDILRGEIKRDAEQVFALSDSTEHDTSVAI